MNRTRTACSLVAVTSAALLAQGCSVTGSYRPRAPHKGSAPGIEAEIVEASFRQNMVLTLRVRGAKGTRITRGLLAPAVAAPCEEGMRDQGLSIDGHKSWLRPVLVEGEHDVVLAFAAGASNAVITKDPVLDLVLASDDPDAAECVRIAISGRAPELAWERPVDWSLNEAVRLTYPSHPMGSVNNGWSLDLGMGRWLGPVRANLEVGIGSANCNGNCPPEPDGDSGSGGFLWFPMRLSVDGYLIETTGFGLAAEIAYQQFSAVRANPDRSSRWETNRGPRAALRFDATGIGAAGWPGGGRQGALGIEFSLSRWASSSDSTEDAALVWGIGFVNHVGF